MRFRSVFLLILTFTISVVPGTTLFTVILTWLDDIRIIMGWQLGRTVLDNVMDECCGRFFAPPSGRWSYL